MQDVSKLIDAICEGWTKCLLPPYGDGEYSSAVDGMTDCNRFVNFVCQKLGYRKFVKDGQTEPMLANEMVDYMQTTDYEWKEIGGYTAQWYANLGELVIAGWRNPTGGHGHVCIVRPGSLGASDHWHSDQVPKVANVSDPDRCRIDLGANYAFSTEPKYFVMTAAVFVS